MCLNLTLDELGLVAGEYSEEELDAAVAAYVLLTYGEGAVVNKVTDNGDGTVHVCGTL